MSKGFAITCRALRRQADALGTDTFEVGIRNKDTEQVQRREWSKSTLLAEKTVRWLKMMNAHL